MIIFAVVAIMEARMGVVEAKETCPISTIMVAHLTHRCTAVVYLHAREEADLSSRRFTRYMVPAVEMVTEDSKRSQIICQGPDPRTTFTRGTLSRVIGTVVEHQVS